MSDVKDENQRTEFVKKDPILRDPTVYDCFMFEPNDQLTCDSNSLLTSYVTSNITNGPAPFNLPACIGTAGGTVSISLPALSRIETLEQENNELKQRITNLETAWINCFSSFPANDQVIVQDPKIKYLDMEEINATKQAVTGSKDIKFCELATQYVLDENWVMSKTSTLVPNEADKQTVEVWWTPAGIHRNLNLNEILKQCMAEEDITAAYDYAKKGLI